MSVNPNDGTPVGAMPPNIQTGEKDPTSIQLAKDMRTKRYGKDVRETMARMIEWTSVLNNFLTTFYVNTSTQNSEYYRQFTDVMKELSEDKDYHSLPEIAGARGGFGTLGERLDKTNAQLAQKVGGGRLASMSDMGQDIKEAMTGGSVAVVGVDSVTEDSIVKGQITPITTNFLKLTEDSNLFDGVFVEGKSLAGNSPLTLTNGTMKIGIVPIQPNTAYSVVKEDTPPDSDGYHRFRIATTSHTVSQLKNSNYNVVMDGKSFTLGDGTDYVSVLSGPNDRSLLFMLSRDYDPYVEVTEGIKTELLGLGYEQKFEFKDNILINENKKKKLVFFGDSLVQLKNLPDLVADITGDDIVDVSFAGAALTRHHTYYDAQSVMRLTEQIIAGNFTPLNTALNQAEADGQDVTAKRINQANLVNTDFNKIDGVIIMAGTNDYGGARHPIDQFESDVRVLIENFAEINPKMEVYFVTPPFRADWKNSSYPHDLKEYIAVIERVSNEHGHPVKNMFETGGVNEFNYGTFLNHDGLHQNDTGDSLWAEKISKYLTSN